MLTAGSALLLPIGLRADKVLADSPSVGDIIIGELEKRLIAGYYQRHLVAY